MLLEVPLAVPFDNDVVSVLVECDNRDVPGEAMLSDVKTGGPAAVSGRKLERSFQEVAALLTRLGVTVIDSGASEVAVEVNVRFGSEAGIIYCSPGSQTLKVTAKWQPKSSEVS